MNKIIKVCLVFIALFIYSAEACAASAELSAGKTQPSGDFSPEPDQVTEMKFSPVSDDIDKFKELKEQKARKRALGDCDPYYISPDLDLTPRIEAGQPVGGILERYKGFEVLADMPVHGLIIEGVQINALFFGTIVINGFVIVYINDRWERFTANTVISGDTILIESSNTIISKNIVSTPIMISIAVKFWDDQSFD